MKYNSLYLYLYSNKWLFYDKENGVGLGLYLAKIASDALNAKISIKNREDGKNGAIAKLEFTL